MYQLLLINRKRCPLVKTWADKIAQEWRRMGVVGDAPSSYSEECISLGGSDWWLLVCGVCGVQLREEPSNAEATSKLEELAVLEQTVRDARASIGQGRDRDAFDLLSKAVDVSSFLDTPLCLAHATIHFPFTAIHFIHTLCPTSHFELPNILVALLNSLTISYLRILLSYS